MSTMNVSDLAHTAQQAAIKAGEILREGFYTEIKTTSKSSHHDVVTILIQNRKNAFFLV